MGLDLLRVVLGATVAGVIARVSTRCKLRSARPLGPVAPATDHPTSSAGEQVAGMSADQTKELEQLKLLFDYTKFHIGLYITLAGAYIALMSSDYGKRLFSPNKLAGVAVVAFLITGLAGGIIASSCSHHTSFTKLMATKIAPFFKREFPCPLIPNGHGWANIEHTAFWVGIVAAVLSFGFRPFGLDVLGVPVRGVSVDSSTAGYGMVLEWNVSGGDYQKLADFGADRVILVCAESEGGIEFEVDGRHEKPKAGGPTEFACRGVQGRAVSAKSLDGRPQRGKLLVR